MLNTAHRTLLVLLLPALLSACDDTPLAASHSRPAPTVKVITLTPQTVEDHLFALGSLLANESVDISSSVTEKILSIHFDDGQTVDAGQLLVSLNQDEEAAQLQSARADLAEHERELLRLQGLLRNQSAAQTEYDQRQTSKLRAESKIAEVQALIAERTIRAPFAGVVGLRQVSPGALISPGTVITSLDDIRQLRLDFQLPSIKLGKLAPGQKILVHSDAFDADISARVSAIATRVDPANRSVTVRAIINNAEGALKPGMLMRVTLISGERESLLIPESALQSVQLAHYAWLAIDGKAARRTVTLGMRKPGFVEVVSGLNAGEQLIYEGYSTLQDGMSITVQEQ
jgi:membrane fusion protein (multidrug efflux system)